jgi:metaxin
MSHTDESTESPQQSRAQPQKSSRSIFDVPAPIKQLFDRFPLLTYPTNELPQRAPQHRNAHVLYVFTSEDGALRGAPSFNPACLKWQVRAT